MTTLLCRCFAYMPRLFLQKSSAVHDRTYSVTPPVFSVTTAVSGGVRLYLLDGRGGEMVSVRTVLHVVLNFAFLPRTSLRRGARACRIVVPHHKRVAINLTALLGPLASMNRFLTFIHCCHRRGNNRCWYRNVMHCRHNINRGIYIVALMKGTFIWVHSVIEIHGPLMGRRAIIGPIAPRLDGLERLLRSLRGRTCYGEVVSLRHILFALHPSPKRPSGLARYCFAALRLLRTRGQVKLAPRKRRVLASSDSDDVDDVEECDGEEEGEEEEEAEAMAEKAADEAVENRVDTPSYTPTPSPGHNETGVESNSSPLHRKDLEGAKALVAFSAGKAVLMTKFGNIIIGSEDEIEAQSEIRIAVGTEDMLGQKSAAKTYGILEFVRDNSRVRYGHIL
uniref:OSJNBb0013J13.18 protein n=1 Tax=Oryza sativa subsp. japonica TaxID=39947 RepID=Q7XP02_ORYSJ|nr:OSJNBb0013J13.18 [Oryza sativa Japonica Group]